MNSSSVDLAASIRSFRAAGVADVVLFDSAKYGFAPVMDSSVAIVHTEEALRTAVEERTGRMFFVSRRMQAPADLLRVLSDRDPSKAWCLAGKRAVRPFGPDDVSCEMEWFDRSPNGVRYDRNDSGDQEVGVVTKTGVLLSGERLLRLVDGFERTFSDPVRISAALRGTEIVCMDAPDSWGRPVRARTPNRGTRRIDPRERAVLAVRKPESPRRASVAEKATAAWSSPAEKRRVIIGMATYPARLHGMLSVVDALRVQCDRMYVSMNGFDDDTYEKTRLYMSEYGNVELLRFNGDDDLGCQNKFRGLGACGDNDYFLTVDDDIDYPHDYVERLVAKIDLYGGNRYVSFHGSTFDTEDGVIVEGSKKNVLTYSTALDRDTPVNMCGTGVGGCVPRRLGLSFGVFDHARNSGDDELLAIWCRDRGIPMTVAAHERMWLSPMKGVESIGALWRNQDSMSTRMRMLRESGRWPDVSHGRFFRIVVPVYRSAHTLQRAMASILRQSFDDYVVCVCDDHSPEDEKAANRSTVEAMGRHGLFVDNDGQRYAGTARNRAMELAKDAEYTLFLDADDEYAYDGVLQELHDFIVAHSYPDVVVLPFYHHSGRATSDDISCVTSPAKLAACRYQAPWFKCIRTCIVPRFAEGLRRSNDVMQHFKTADVAKTVAPFTRPCIRYKMDGDTTMFGSKASENGKSIEAVSSLLKCAGDILSETWRHDYMRQPIERCVQHVLRSMVPNAISILGAPMSSFIKVSNE